MALHTDSWHFVLFRKASQQLEKSTDLCPHVPPGGPPALRGTFAPPWPLVISLHRPFYAPFLFSILPLGLTNLLRISAVDVLATDRESATGPDGPLQTIAHWAWAHWLGLG